MPFRKSTASQRLWQRLIQLMPCAKPNDLRLVFVKLQAITGHPIANALKAASEAFNCFLARGRWYTDIQLCIVCIRVTSETELRRYVLPSVTPIVPLFTKQHKKLRYRRVTARCVLSVVILPITTQQCRNYLYDKSWPNRWYEVGGLAGGNVS